MKKSIKSYIKQLSCLVAISGFLSACSISSAEEGEWVSLEYTDGQDLFVEKCGMCHRAGGMGTGILARRMSPELALLENREDLPQSYIGVVVRNGLNTMFPLSRGEVSDKQLEKISLYLATGEH